MFHITSVILRASCTNPAQQKIVEIHKYIYVDIIIYHEIAIFAYISGYYYSRIEAFLVDETQAQNLFAFLIVIYS